MRHEFHPEALAEYEAAALYYAERDPRVGQRFVAAVEDAIDRILDSPARWRVLNEDVRRCLTRVFPNDKPKRGEVQFCWHSHHCATRAGKLDFSPFPDEATPRDEAIRR